LRDPLGSKSFEHLGSADYQTATHLGDVSVRFGALLARKQKGWEEVQVPERRAELLQINLREFGSPVREDRSDETLLPSRWKGHRNR
jgi:hypothetical protein